MRKDITQYTFSDVLIAPKFSDIASRKEVNITTDLGMVHPRLPVISANMKTVTGPEMAIAMAKAGGLGIINRFYKTHEEYLRAFEDVYLECTAYNVGVSIGVHQQDYALFDKLYNKGARIFCIDVAHGHHALVRDMIRYISSTVEVWKPDSTIDPEAVLIIAGNVATGEAVYDLNDWGAHVAKIGIGPGSVCHTRRNTGVGVSQLFALEQAHQEILDQHLPIKLIADGGITSIGDIPKALRYADAVMLGNMLAGTNETPGKIRRDSMSRLYKFYAGSASVETKESTDGAVEYIEGVSMEVPAKGPVAEVLKDIREGIQSAFSYVGARNITEFRNNCEMFLITDGGRQESKI